MQSFLYLLCALVSHLLRQVRTMQKVWRLLALGLLAVSSLLFGYRPARADDPTPTPTMTPYSIYHTPTPRAADHGECPGGLPDGWGTVTPAAMWLAQCGQCLYKLTAQPTSAIWGATVTPGLPTNTPAPTYTPVPSGVYTYFVDWSPAYTVTSIQPTAGTHWEYSHIQMPEPSFDYRYETEMVNYSVAGFVMRFHVVYSNGSGYIYPVDSEYGGRQVLEGSQSGWSVGEGQGGAVYAESDQVRNGLLVNGQVAESLRYESLAHSAVAVLNEISGTMAYTLSEYIGGSGVSAINWTQNVVVFEWGWIMRGPMPVNELPPGTPVPGGSTSTPVPTRTPVPGSSCNEVRGIGPVSGGGVVPGVIGDITVTGSTCFDTPGIDVDLSGLNLIPGMGLGRVYLETLHVCLKSITLPEFNLIGITVSSDTLLLVMGAITFLGVIIGRL